MIEKPKWGVDRRKRISIAMADPDNADKRRLVITFTRKVIGASSLSEFFDRYAVEDDMQNFERILGI